MVRYSSRCATAGRYGTQASYALIEFFKGSKEGEKVKKHLRKGNVIISSICTYEVLYNLGRYCDKKTAEGFYMSQSMLHPVIPVDEHIALLAVELRRKHDMPMGDALIYATAKANNAKVISGCRHFRALRKERDVVVI